MIGALVAILSLNLSSTLVSQGVVAGVLPVTGATVSTPINVTSPGHKIPKGRVLHGVLTGVVGMTEANGLWVFTPLDADTLTLTTFDTQGGPVNSVGTNPYISGGSIAYAFPDYGILLGRRNVALSSSVASPRIVFVPTDGKAYGLDPYGGFGPVSDDTRGTPEQIAERVQPQLGTQNLTFEVYVTGAAPDFGAPGLSPDFADFDATQAIAHALISTMFLTQTPDIYRVLHESWPSQREGAASMLQRGQQWCGIIQFHIPVVTAPLRFVPIGTFVELLVEPVNPGSTDPILITVT